MPHQYHVTCNDTKSKKLITVDEKASLVRIIQERFSVTTDIILQQPYLDDWVDVEDLADLPDGGKLLFLQKPVTGNKLIKLCQGGYVFLVVCVYRLCICVQNVSVTNG